MKYSPFFPASCWNYLKGKYRSEEKKPSGEPGFRFLAKSGWTAGQSTPSLLWTDLRMGQGSGARAAAHSLL